MSVERLSFTILPNSRMSSLQAAFSRDPFAQADLMMINDALALDRVVLMKCNLEAILAFVGPQVCWQSYHCYEALWHFFSYYKACPKRSGCLSQACVDPSVVVTWPSRVRERLPLGRRLHQYPGWILRLTSYCILQSRLLSPLSVSPEFQSIRHHQRGHYTAA
jgi:hypothetical protein